MSQLQDALQKRPIVYITRDFERAAGLPLNLVGLFVITNATEHTEDLPNTICIQGDTYLDTHELLSHEKTIQWMADHPEYSIVVFKNSSRIERICAEQKWHLLNPPATLSSTIEQKISQVEWLDDLTSMLPPFRITTCGELTAADIGSIAQFNSGHTGTGTIHLADQAAIDALHLQYPNRPVRVTKFIQGMVFTLNTVVGKKGIAPSTISYQITGLAPCTDNAFATVGNDWTLPKNILSIEQQKKITAMATEIGTQMQSNGWRGLFGIDVIIESGTNQLFLIEINARQPASSTYESMLQASEHPTTIEAHMLALLGASVDAIAPIEAGAQLFDRRTDPPQVHRFDTGIMADHRVLHEDIANTL